MKTRIKSLTTIKYIGYFVFIGLVAFRVLLALNTPNVAYFTEGYDDALLFKYMESMLNGQWLGTYDQLTLVKGISYSIFLYLCSKCMIPYMLGLVMLLIVASWCFVRALRPVMKTRGIRMVVFLLLVYSPVSFYYLISQRMYRMALLPEMSLLVISCFLGIFFRTGFHIKKILPWCIGAAVSLAFFWNLREDSIWILPFVFAISLCGTVKMYLENHKILLQQVVIILAPIFLWGMSLLCICAVNQKYYGYFGVNDRTSGEFTSTMSYLYSINGDEKGEFVYEENEWVSLEEIEAVEKYSATLYSIDAQIHEKYDAWGGFEVLKGDMIQWALRDAVSASGYYQDASTAQAFYKSVNQEIQQAIDENKLSVSRDLQISSQAKGIKADELGDVIVHTFVKVWQIMTYKECIASGEHTSTGEMDQIRQMEGVTGSKLINEPLSRYELNGWIFCKDDQGVLEISVIDSEGNTLAIPYFVASQDVYNAFPQYANAIKSRFDITLYDVPQDILIDIYIDGQLVDTIVPQDLETELYRCDLEWNYDAGMDEIIPYSSRVATWENRIIRLYQIVGGLFTILAVLSVFPMAFQVYRGIKRKEYDMMYLMIALCGVLLSGLLLCFGVAYFSRYFSAEMEIYLGFYMAGAFMLFQAWKYTSVWYMINQIKGIRYE